MLSTFPTDDLGLMEILWNLEKSKDSVNVPLTWTKSFYGNSSSKFIISTLFKYRQTIMCSHLFILKVHWLSPSTFRDFREFPSSRGHRSEKSRAVNYLGNKNALNDICNGSITNYIIIEQPYCITATHYTIHFGSFPVNGIG